MALAAAAQQEQKYDDLRIIYGLDTPKKIREFRTNLTQSLAEEAGSGDYSRFVLSSEHCSSRLTTTLEVERLAKILWSIGKDITVVIYVRRQDDFLCSTYSTDVKSGYAGRMKLPDAAERRFRYDYDEMLRRWSAVFGRENIVCRIYQQEFLKNGDVVDDFADLIGLTLDSSYVRPPRVNESLNVTALEFLRIFNELVPRFKDNKSNPVRADIVQVLQRVSSGPSPTLSKKDLAIFMGHFRLSNKRVAQEYFGKICPTGDPLFGEASHGKDKAEMKSIDVETAIRITALLWEDKQARIDKMSQTMSGLREKIEKLQRKRN
ncbi:MAG TPA: hypothetical protein VGK90_00760 [Rhizomicrobium sp.]